MSDALVFADNISRTYQVDGVSTEALSPTGFEIRPGELIALTGPSGSGKTTLLHLLSGLDSPSTGTIEWPTLGPRGALRPAHVSIAFQGPSLIPSLDVAENVAFPLLVGGGTQTDAMAAALAMLDRLGLSELRSKLPGELSGGQSQRVALARALVTRPALLLADEPTGQQDHMHATLLLDLLLQNATEHGIAVVAATHDASAAERFPTRWAMRDGRLDTKGV